jgi:predicted amidophosphoribosyltransferase
VCPACGSPNRQQSQFCAACGAALLKYCAQCGRQIGLDAQVCIDYAQAGRQIPLAAGRCQGCGRQNDQNAEVCAKCGARLLVKCPQCAAVAPASFSFCTECGFQYSRLVTERLVPPVQKSEEQRKLRAPKLNFSLVLMIVLSVISVLVMIYILSEML